MLGFQLSPSQIRHLWAQGEDDVIFILAELTDEALGLAELGRIQTGRKKEAKFTRNWPRR